MYSTPEKASTAAGLASTEFDEINYNKLSSRSESLYSLRLKEYSRKIPVARLSIKWEKFILDLIPSLLMKQHPRCVKKNLTEIRDIYKSVMENCAIASIVVTDVIDDDNDRNRRCENFHYDVPRQRQLLANKYFLSHGIMRQIVEIASVKLASVIIDLDRIIIDEKKQQDCWNTNFFEISELRDTMMSHVAQTAATIKNDYYNEIVRSILSTIINERSTSKGAVNFKKIIRNTNGNDETIKLLRCATNLFSQQIVKIMIRTIDDLTERLADYRRRCPRLNIRLLWKNEDNRLSVDPPISEIYSMWHSLVSSIENIANDLPIFEELCCADDGNSSRNDESNNRRYRRRMRVSVPDFYAIESHRRINEILRKVLDPLERYLVEIAEEFDPVTRGETTLAGHGAQNIAELMSMIRSTGGITRNLSVHCSSVMKLKRQNERANDIAESVDYDVGRLDRRNARIRLKREIADTRKTIVEAMLLLHEEYNEEICRDFAKLRDRLLDVPNDARDLFKLAETIAYPSMRLLLDEFETRVTRSIEMLSSLLAVTSDMTERHANINGKTINWLLVEIEPIILRSNTLCEAMKSELEDELQRRIARLNAEIEDVVPKFEILDQMDDAGRIDEYAEHVRSLVDNLNELDRRIETINYEERLFKFPDTSFSSVEEIRDILVPVAALIALMREWRRDQSVWLDGPFEYIDARIVREKTIDHYRANFETLNASLRSKIKVDKQQSSTAMTASGGNSTKRLKLFTGVVDDPDPMQQPAPMTLCWQVLEEVKQFEQHLELIECVCNPSLRDRHWHEISLIYERLNRTAATLSSTLTNDNNDDESLTIVTPPDAGTTLRKLILLDLAKDIDEYRVVSIGANKELALANSLDEMIIKWDNVDFSITAVTPATTTSTNNKTFARLDEIYTLMEEHEVIIEEMRVSYFVKPIAGELEKFSRSLTNVRSIVKTWLRIRNEWFDLEAVFRRNNEQLGPARDLFFRIRVNLLDVVERRITDRPKFQMIVEEFAVLSGLLVDADESLENVRATVENYVERARCLYPRFYFVSDRQVIEIIFEPNYSKRMKLLVRKCFTDMRSVRRCGSYDYCASIIDSFDREFELKNDSAIGDGLDGEAETNDYSLLRGFIITERAITRTVRHTILECFRDLQEERHVEDPQEIGSSNRCHSRTVTTTLTNCTIGIAAISSWRLYWTSEIERALLIDNRADDDDDVSAAARRSSSRTILASHEAELSCIIEVIMAELRGASGISRKRRVTLVLFIVQAGEQRDITRLVISNVSKRGGRTAQRDFTWRAQIRHYLRDDNVKVAILDTEERYGYEYSGIYDREPIVRTPLTERSYHSLMEAHRNRLYGLVFGPGAIGKSQTIEALARTLGVHLRTVDCAHRHLDEYARVKNVFSGLVAWASSMFSLSACWLLFKHLDLLTLQGLSVMAQRITWFVSRPLTNDKDRFSFVTATISAERGETPAYSLPDALKIMFRPIAFAFPDTTRIVEVLLFAEGFSTASILAGKLRLFEKHSIEQSYHQRSCRNPIIRAHQFGIIKSVVRTACALKTRYPCEAEDALFLRAIVDVHLPAKLTTPSELTDFQHIIRDLFPNVVLPPPNYEHLLSAIQRVTGERIPSPGNESSFLGIKIIQLYEMLLVRHTVLLVGPSLAGKTTVIDNLGLSLLDYRQRLRRIDVKIINENDDARAPPKINTIRINHNSMTDDELYGKYDDECRGSGKLCWKDGILSRALRSFEIRDEERTDHRSWHWLILDGSLHESFILDKLTTLLDDNDKTLVLRSGERIPLNNSTSVIFETSSTMRATPATISRCGIVYLEEEGTIGWKLRMKRWIVEHQGDTCKLVPRCSSSVDNPSEYAVFLQSLLEWSLGSCLDFLRQETHLHPCRLPISQNHTIISVLRLLEMFLKDALVGGCGVQFINESNKDNDDEERAKLYNNNFFTWSQAALLMAIVWALGGSLNRNSRAALDEFCKSMWQSNNSSSGGCEQRQRIISKFPCELINVPNDGLIQDYIYVFIAPSGKSGGACWRHLSDVLKRDYINGGDIIDYFSSVKAGPTSYVPTIDSIRYVNLFQSHVKYCKPFVVSGETATGKTLYMRHLLRTKLSQREHRTNFFSFANSSLRSSSARAGQKMFLSRMKKLSKGVYGAAGAAERARLCINFIDDMRVTTKSRDESALMMELIRQYYDDSHRCWYDIDSGERIFLSDILFLGAIDPAASKRLDDDNYTDWQEVARFFRHFNLYSIDRPSSESIYQIHYNILLANLRMNMFSTDVVGSVTSIVNATMDVYSSIVNRLRPIPSKFQYRFTPRDVTRVIIGCSLIHKDSAETKVTLMRLWVHEVLRVFADRIINHEDAEWLFGRLKDSAGAHFKDSWETTFDNLPKYETDDQQQQLTRQSFRSLVFSDFMQIPDALSVDPEVNRNSVNVANDNNGKHRRYEEIICSRDSLKNRAISYLEGYNNVVDDETKRLDIIIIPEILQHLMRICRILDTPGGSLLIVCFGPSSGRRSLTALAAHIKSQRLEELSGRVIESMMTPESSLPAAWRHDFKRACKNCCCPAATYDKADYRISVVEGESTFFINDRDIIGAPVTNWSILGDLCSLMKTGKTVPCLFTREERKVIVERSRLLAQRGDRNREMSSHDVMDYFYSKCQENIHFVLYFNSRDGITSGMQQRGRTIDAEALTKILDHCTIDCYERWPDQAFFEIGEKFMRDIDIGNDVRSRIIVASKCFYDSVILRRGSSGKMTSGLLEVTSINEDDKMPVSAYIHMMKLYGVSFKRRENETRETRNRYLSGLDKLKMADEEVREMRSVLTRLRPELELSANETAETMRIIERENVGAAMATIQVKREEEVANRIAQVAGILKEECEADLAVAIPILEDAIAALNTLKPTDITLVKAMKNPPDTVKLVLAAVCVMLGVSPDRTVDPVTGKKSIDYWAPSKRILGDMNFLQNLKDYDKDNIPASVMSVVNKTYINDDNFMPHIVAKASSAAEGLCKWVRAMVSYDEVAKVVAPKKEKLAAAERECNASLDYLNEKRTRLAALNEKLAALNTTLEATLAKKSHLEKQVDNCTGKLRRAEALIASLAGEKARWLETADALARTWNNLPGDVLLSCGLVALLSSFDANHRNAHLAEWINKLARLTIINSGGSYEFFGSPMIEQPRGEETTIFKSRDDRLRISDVSPFDRANTTIVAHSLLRPLIFDPQNLANVWIKRVESTNGLVTIKPTNPRWFAVIRACYEKNLPILLENLDRAEYLERTPLILRYVGTKCQWWSPSSTSFRLYMTSRISFNEIGRQSQHAAHMYKRFCLVNFTLANEALEDRLLEIIVSRERPELRDDFDRLMISSASNRRLLEQEENKILEILSASSDTCVNIIEDERAIEALDRSKILSLEITTREAETAITTKREMNELRAIYRPLTRYCAALYDTLASLVYLNNMYRFSLDWFIRLYVRSIDTSMRSPVLDKRLCHLSSSFTLMLETSVRNSLLDEHKLLYSFLLSLKILLDRGEINETELSRCLPLMLVPVDIDSVNPVDNDTSRIIALARQLGDTLPDVFQNLSTIFHKDASSWTACNGDHTWNKGLTDFQRLILVNRLRPDKTLDEVSRLVENTLGTRLNSIPTSFIGGLSSRDSVLVRSFDESSCIVPLIFLLPSYLEPHRVIEMWARKVGYSSGIVRFSMPPLMTSKRPDDEYNSPKTIERSIETARQRGGWILLENCHLATDEWLTRLEDICESLDNNREDRSGGCFNELPSLDATITALTFRLWLTSYPSERFPTSILHAGIKIHCERPSDRMRHSLRDFYATEPLNDPDFYNPPRNDTDGCAGHNGRLFSKLVYALCFFHAIVTGTNRFYERAWNVSSYEFTDSDLKISIGHLRGVFYRANEREIDADYYERESSCSAMILDTLVYLTGECYYGGKILDPTDRNRLNVILRYCCNKDIVRVVDKSYVLIDDNPYENEYSIPNRSEYREFIRHIENFVPNGESAPRSFGLDENAAIVRDCRNTDYFVRSLARLSTSFLEDIRPTNECNYCCHSSRDVTSSQESNKLTSWLTLSRIIRDVRAKLMLEDTHRDSHLLNISPSVREKYPVVYEEPLNAVLIEQVEYYNEIVKIIRESLVDIEITYEFAADIDERPASLLSLTLVDKNELARCCLIANKVPSEWLIISGDVVTSNDRRCHQRHSAFSSLSVFINFLSKRRDFLNNWMKMGHYGCSMWLGGLINTRKFLSAARLTLSRKHEIPLDRLFINYEVTSVSTSVAKQFIPTEAYDDVDSVCLHIHGLYLSGAAWDIENSSLVESLPKLHFDLMPMIRFRAHSLDCYDTANRSRHYYSCPVNSSSPAIKTRNFHFLGTLSSDYVMTIPLYSKERPPEYWIKRGTLLFCNKRVN